jgi:hypothetical protein
VKNARLMIATMAAAMPLVVSGVAVADNPHGTPPGQAKKDQQAAAPETRTQGEGARSHGAGKPAKPEKRSKAKAPKAAKPKQAKAPKAAKPKTHGPAGKTTICHSTGSATNPYVTITVSDNALPAHARHHDGRDVIPAPAGGCPGGTAKPEAGGTAKEHTKVTICHATGSQTNPYVKITIAEPAVEAHKRHQDGRDVIPAPAEGCPGAAAAATPATTESSTAKMPPPTVATGVTQALQTLATTPAAAGQVLGETVSGGTDTERGASSPASAGDTAAATTTRETGANRLPFTGLDLILVVAAGLGLLLAGVALRRVMVAGRTAA